MRFDVVSTPVLAARITVRLVQALAQVALAIAVLSATKQALALPHMSSILTAELATILDGEFRVFGAKVSIVPNTRGFDGSSHS